MERKYKIQSYHLGTQRTLTRDLEASEFNHIAIEGHVMEIPQSRFKMQELGNIRLNLWVQDTNINLFWPSERKILEPVKLLSWL